MALTPPPHNIPGQQPYTKDADETIQCPTCQRYNDTDAAFCDQCGARLPPSAFPSNSLAEREQMARRMMSGSGNG